MTAKISASTNLCGEDRERLDAKYAGEWMVTGLMYKYGGNFCGLRAKQGEREITLRSSDFDILVIELIP